MRKFVIRLLVLSSSLFVITVGVDHLLLSPDCPPCHTDQTRDLPMFSRTTTLRLVRIPANSFHFRARVAGMKNVNGDGVILLHGFPESSIMWEPTIELLAAEGFRAIAFDQRGYSPGARPGSIASYTIDELVDDVVAIADAAGFQQFHLVGHDWGAVIGWVTADRHPDRVVTGTALSMPHLAAFREALFENGDQLRRSSYVLLTWIPGLAEFVFGFNRAAYLQKYSWSLMPKSQRDEYTKIFSERTAIRGAINWYRANNIAVGPEVGDIYQPTLYIWGNKDQALGRVGAEKTADYIRGPYRFIKLPAAHQLMAEKPNEISREILAHLTNWNIKRINQRSSIHHSKPNLGKRPCGISKPHCLRVNVSPAGEYIKIINRCDLGYSGLIKIRCTRWENDSWAKYQFKLNPGGIMIHETVGLNNGDCYFDQSICSSNDAEKVLDWKINKK